MTYNFVRHKEVVAFNGIEIGLNNGFFVNISEIEGDRKICTFLENLKSHTFCLACKIHRNRVRAKKSDSKVKRLR